MKLFDRIRKWNMNRLDNSTHFDMIFVIRNPLNAACIIQTAKEYGVRIDKKHGIDKQTKEKADADFYVCDDCQNEKFNDFLISLTDKIDMRVGKEYGIFRTRFWCEEK